MDKSFDPKQIESKWYARWEDAGCFKPSGDGEPYAILLPPPNVTGTLHMGHAFQQTIMDALIRHARMSGRNTLWQGGTDHAGIATQKIVENQLAAEGKTRHDLGREAFVERVWQWKQESGSTITQQMRRLGASIDWSRERFTMDEGLSTAVRKVFVEWYRAGLIYRGNRLVNWDPVLMTAVSDLEVNNVERDGHLWSIRYNVIDPRAGGIDHVVIATTRPETMLGDVAVAVHPEDERYATLLGKRLRLPLAGREIPVIADDYVDREFGTGCVKITPAHDFNDYAIGQRHKLPLLTVLTLDARVNGNAPENYRGLDRYAARKQILADLEAQGLLVETKPHKLQVPVSQRSDAVIEPMLTDQWFVDLTRDALDDGSPGGRRAITQPALDAVRSGDIKFVPENWTTTYTQWLDNIQDWCISRQLWWGHRIPAWYDEAGNIFVGEDEADARAHGNVRPIGALRQDDDVLDTWFSSALWPFSTLGWPSDHPAKNERGEIIANWRADKIFLPSAVLVTGFDIIFFWVARMVMTTLYFTGRVPFREVYINAIVRDAEGQKMSKSKGNTLDPLDLIDGIALPALIEKSTKSLLIPQVREKVEKRIRKDYPDGIAAIGTDALRFTFAALASYSRTINFDLKRAEGYKAFCNKLWNAARFVLMNIEPDSLPPLAGTTAVHGQPLRGGRRPEGGNVASGNPAPHPNPPPHAGEGDERTARPGGRNGAPPHAGEGDERTARPGGRNGAPPHAGEGDERTARPGGRNGAPPHAGEGAKTEAERWIISRLHATLAEVAQHFASYRFDLLAQALYEFVWNDYCDWFLELCKPALNGHDANASASARQTLLVVLETALRALHPIIPFITEEIWQELFLRSPMSAKDKPASLTDFSRSSILGRPYPRADEFPVDEAASAEIEWLKAALTGVRRIRSEMNIAPGKIIPVLFADGGAEDRRRADKFAARIEFLARCEPLRWLQARETEPAAAVAVVGNLRVMIPLAGLIDLDAERTRLKKEIARIEGEIRKCEGKLGNASFVDHAPAAVVEQERTRLADWNTQLAALGEQASRLQST